MAPIDVGGVTNHSGGNKDVKPFEAKQQQLWSVAQLGKRMLDRKHC